MLSTKSVCYLLYLGFSCFLLYWIFEVSALYSKSIALYSKSIALQEGNMKPLAYDRSFDERRESAEEAHLSVHERLSRHATNNTIVLSICNKGMALQWLQQWYVSAKRIGIGNIMVIATDSEAFNWIRERLDDQVIHVRDVSSMLKSNRWNKKKKLSGSFDEAYNFKSSGYEEVVVQRATILSSIMLKSKLDIIYSDMDIHWIRNPSLLLKRKYSSYDVCLQREKGDEVGDNNCSGFMYLRNTHNTRLFLRAWEFYIKQRMKKKKKIY